MRVRFNNLHNMLSHGYDDVIDVRSPAEFAEDHVPGAINLPALDDAERARVGTIYTQTSPFAARKIGAALVARNVAGYLEKDLSDKSGGWRPLVYCWRGGQRSGSVATILKEVGWRAEVVEGGYQTYRRLVKKTLYDGVLPFTLVLLDGNTGTAKTRILGCLDALGEQTLDLEGMARHRGSLLGAMAEDQPAQKGFETTLAAKLAGFDPARPVYAEAESSRVGAIILPPALWAAMKAARRVEISAPLSARATFLVNDYADLIEDRETLSAKLDVLRKHRGHEVADHWQNLLARGDMSALAQALMQDHYDPTYQKSRARHDATRIGQVTLSDLTPQDQKNAAQQIRELVANTRLQVV